MILFACIFLPPARSLAEGSKELYITTHNTYLYLCNDFVGKCNPTPPGNGERSQFAIYGCNEVDRLYFVKLNPSEVIYLGFNGAPGINDHIVFEIKDMSGTVVYSETTVPTAGTGFIANIAQARVGPDQIYTTGGYTAINFHPATTGTFYIEFNQKNVSNTVVTGNFSMNLFDITVYDTVSLQVKPGRMYSKSWQFQENGGCSAKTYVYSSDSIITSCAFNNLVGGVWVQYCNQYGCYNTGNFPSDRKSLYHLQALLPEFKVFFNLPDATLFPPAVVLGSIVAPYPWGDRNCLTGHVLFHVFVNKPGKVTISLAFSGGYTGITLTITNAVVGENTFDWNGLDGGGLVVPNNTTITFTVSYINGLTNLPLYDVETNNNGFTISLESPTGAQVTSYWDDTNIVGPPVGTNNSTVGCPTPPCHSWGNNWGNLNTINTWWYNVSSSMTQPAITEWRNPGTLVFQQIPPQNYCENTSGHVFSVTADANTDVYHWSYTPATGVTLVPSGNSVTVSFGPGATSGILSVYGTNTNCATQGPTSTLAITINAAPLPVIVGPASVCLGSTGNSYATQTGMTVYNWSVSAGGMITSGQGTSNAHVTWNTAGANTISVSYTNANGCAAANPTIYPVTVHSLPTPTISGLGSVCQGSSGIVYTTEAGMSGYIWSVSSGANITGGGNGFNFITLTWTTAGIHTVYVNYTDTYGCTALAPSSYIVTVNQLPDVTFVYNTPNSCSGIPLNIVLLSNVSGASFTWTATGSSGNVSPQFTSGTGNITIPFTNTGTAIENVVFSVIPSATGCSPVGAVLSVPIPIYPVPDLIATPPTLTVCSNSQANITFSSSVQNTTYSWIATGGPGITPATVNGTGNISQTFQNSGNTQSSVSFDVVPMANGCSHFGLPPYILYVNPLPVPVISGTTPVCEASAGNVYSTGAGNSNYAWSVPTGGSITSGGSASENTITITWTAPGIQNVNVGYTDGNGCTASAPSTFPVTVNPLPNAVFTYNTPNSCSGLALDIQLSSSVPGASFAWTATGSSGNVNPQFTAGTGNISIPFINTGTSIENVVFSIVPTALGCSALAPYASNPIPIYPVPDLVTTPASLTVCSNSQANIALSSVVQNTTYSWTATGGAGITPATANGTGNIAATFQNSGTTPGSVSFTIIPTANGCSHLGIPPYLLSVNPKPGVVFPASPANPQTICGGTSFVPVSLQSTVTLPGISYAWTAAAFDPINPTASITGFTTPGSGNTIPGQTISSLLTVAGVINYEVTPTYTNGGATCPGDPSEYQVIVNPSPTVALVPGDPTGQTICSGTASQAITFTPNVNPAFTIYTWQAVEVVGINPPILNGTSNSIPGQLLTVTGPAQGHVKYKVTPTFLGSGSNTCLGSDSYSSIFVNPLPAPVITSPSPQTVCELQTNVQYSTPNIVGNSYTWNVTGAAAIFNANTSTVTVNWGPYTGSPGTLTVTEKITATGCQFTTPVFSVILQQRPIPTLTGAQTVCEATTGNIYQTEPLMSNYTWTIAGGSITSGGTPASNTATVTWITPGSQWIQVNYVNALGCPGFPAKLVTITVNPLPVSSITEGTGAVCDQHPHVYQALADAASTFTWSILPSSNGSISTGQGTNTITIDWLAAGNATVAVTATKNATGCATSSTFPVLVHPSPAPSFTACFDLKTTPNAKKFNLKGGTPYVAPQGVYSGNRVSYNAISGMYEFDPYGASVGTYPITYTFTNTFGCVVSTTPVSITIMNTSFICNGNLTDIRDGKKYKTSMIGGKCWMKENLAYGTSLDATQPQTDNCIVEKYCLNSDVNCTTYGGLYQWDELLAYASTSASQGICPPEWHIPTETEWQTMINTLVSSVTPPVDGFGGSFLKDDLLNPGFLALIDGIYYLNNNWAFTTGTLTGTMFWTSTANGAERGMARGVNLINPSISKYPGSRGNAFSVRCVRD